MKIFSLRIEEKTFDLNFSGNIALLDSSKISIIGSRNCTQYTKNFVTDISSNVIYKNKLNSTRINLTEI